MAPDNRHQFLHDMLHARGLRVHLERDRGGFFRIGGRILNDVIHIGNRRIDLLDS